MWWAAGATVAAASGWVMAQAGGSDTSSELVQQGPLGVAVLALAAFARAAYNREKDRADRLEAALTAAQVRELALAEKMGGEVTATVIEATKAMERLTRHRRES